MTSRRARFALPCLLAALHAAALAAGDDAAIRDPMQAPAVPAAVQPAASAGAAASESGEAPVRHLMVIDGRRYVIEGGQRLGVGDRLGDARIERIDDGAVWLRDARGVRQVSLFGGIVKRPSRDDEAASSAASAATRVPSSGVEARAKVRSATVRSATRKSSGSAAAADARAPRALAAVPASTESPHPDRPVSHPTR